MSMLLEDTPMEGAETNRGEECQKVKEAVRELETGQHNLMT